ncbi:hypothetical protein I6F07_31210 [Ensifer sp. IC4062]|nr:hypothetical protein [Ensifer sp. IC4062]MCA1444575.1 hypothetical protein [Ensifer sp. IC4062]
MQKLSDREVAERMAQAREFLEEMDCGSERARLMIEMCVKAITGAETLLTESVTTTRKRANDN